MIKDPKWKKFQDLVADEFKDIDPYARSSKGSGNCGEKGDIKFSCIDLHIECKDENKINVFQDKYLQKCIEEVPLHSKKLPVLITRNKENKIRVHMDFLDFVKLYKESIEHD